MSQRCSVATVESLIENLEALRGEALRTESQLGPELAAVHPDCRPSARNLAHYLALRSHDMRDLQAELAALGLSSLGRCEANVLFAIETVLSALYRFTRHQEPARSGSAIDLQTGPALLAGQSEWLLGRARDTRSTRILVTLPREAGLDPRPIRELLAAGMDLMRINCAHDDAGIWKGMLEHLDSARRELRRECRVLFDLGGPKLRTGEFAPGPRVLHLAAPRDERGHELRALRVLLARSEDAAQPPAGLDGRLPLAGKGWSRLRAGLRLVLEDTRGRKRRLELCEPVEQGWIGSCERSLWIEEGTRLRAAHVDLAVQGLPARPGELLLKRGEQLWLVPEGAPLEREGEPCVPCTLPEALSDLRHGERVCFDDGRIVARVVELGAGAVRIQVEQARESGEKLRADKGINLPDSELRCAGLTADDRRDLDFVARHADLVGLSFARTPADVLELQRELASRGSRSTGILVKIETRQGFENLPRILLAGMRTPPFGVMVARGDLAVELGFERLAEVQEEILWLCEAAHVPVVWATQVLDGLTRDGRPSRAEVTDAAMSVRAECVMLNKGPHAAQAVRFLHDVLQRMQQHHSKKRSLLRRLSVSDLARSAPVGTSAPGTTRGAASAQGASSPA